MVINKTRLCGLITLLALPFLTFAASPDTVVRAAIDIGSGATKLRVAEVNLKTNKVEKILVNESFTVQYQEELSKSTDGKFNDRVMATGMEAIKKSKEIAMKYNAEKVIGVATASFRNASNADAFADKIFKETGVKIHIIDQELEGVLAFQATAANISFDPKDLIVWDIGGGSFQFTALDENGTIVVYRGVDASIPFKNHIIQYIKFDNPDEITTPNPMTANQVLRAESYARYIGLHVDQIFKDRIACHPNTRVVGVGNIFAYGIYPLVGKKSTFTKNELANAITGLIGKKDKELGGGDYVNVAVTNPILVLGFMQSLSINQMDIMDINNADGALIFAPFWIKQEAVPQPALKIEIEKEVITQ